MDEIKEKENTKKPETPKENKVESKSVVATYDFIKDGKKYRFNTEATILPSTRLRNEQGEQGAYKFGKYAGKQVTKEQVLKNPELLDLIISNKLGFIREINEKGGN